MAMIVDCRHSVACRRCWLVFGQEHNIDINNAVGGSGLGPIRPRQMYEMDAHGSLNSSFFFPSEERRAKGSPLRDVAGMIRSIDYAIASVRRPDEDASAQPVRERRRSLLREFRRTATDMFLDNYRDASGVDPNASTSRGRGSLLDLMLIEKAAYEVSYELANRPHWVMIPLRGLLNIVERLSGREGRA